MKTLGSPLNWWNWFLCFEKLVKTCTLVTQSMLQLTPNCSELRSMDLFNQILCRFQKYKRKVPPPSLPFGWKKTRRLKVQFMEVNFFFRHPSKSCSVFYILEAKIFFRKDQKKIQIFFLNLHVPGTRRLKNNFRFFFLNLSEKRRWRNFSLIFLEST